MQHVTVHISTDPQMLFCITYCHSRAPNRPGHLHREVVKTEHVHLDARGTTDCHVNGPRQEKFNKSSDITHVSMQSIL
jgi:uncharacterized protein (DUF39 family)